MYKASDIKPKRYPDEKPSKYGIFFGYPSNDGDWFDYIYPCTYPWSERPIQWFIDIPGAPPELKPLAYPENKPSEKGLHWVHDKNRDIWDEALWVDGMDMVWNASVDWYIPYLLDEENEMDGKFVEFTDEELLLELINRNVLGIAPKKTKFVSPHYEVLVAIGNNETARITLPKEGFSELCDIVYEDKREPEIKACPVCGGKANLVHWDIEQYYIVCDVNDCPIRTLYYDTAYKAIEAWNALPRKGE